jgi:predicted anti-sigma-YlaC factor YlaD
MPLLVPTGRHDCATFRLMPDRTEETVVKGETLMPCTCRDIFSRLSEYLDGALSGEVCRETQQHLAVCPSCRALTNTLRKTIELCRWLPQHPIPPDVRRTLLAVVRTSLARGHAAASPRRRG